MISRVATTSIVIVCGAYRQKTLGIQVSKPSSR